MTTYHGTVLSRLFEHRTRHIFIKIFLIKKAATSIFKITDNAGNYLRLMKGNRYTRIRLVGF